MRSGTIAFLLAISSFQLLGHLPAPGWLTLGFLPALLFFKSRRLFIPLFAAAFGFVWAYQAAYFQLDERLPTELQGVDMVVEGIIRSIPERQGRRVRFRFELQQVLAPADTDFYPRQLRLSWYNRPPELRAGERWRLTVRLKQPHGMLNPGSFDYEAWLFREGIDATGYVRDREAHQRLSASWIQAPVPAFRQQFYERLDQRLQQSEYRGLLMALAIGHRGEMSDRDWELLAATGTNHLMAISGLHVGLIAGIAFFLMRWGWAGIPALPQHIPAQKAAALAGLVAALIYAAMAGFSIPTQRALIMVTVVMLGLMVQRPVLQSHTLAVALLLVLLWDPLSVHAPGFWLSFLAVALIFYAMRGRVAPRGWWWRWGRVQWVIALGLAPLVLILFQRVSLISPLANLIAVPWMGLTVIPLTLLGTLLLPLSSSLGGSVLELAQQALHPLWWGLGVMSDAVPAHWGRFSAPSWTLLPALLGMLWLLMPRGWPSRWLGMLGLLPMLLIRPEPPSFGEVTMTLLDVGQGLASVVQTQNHALVFDTGPRYGSFDTGRAVVAPFLRYRGITGLDTLIISHGDNDHMGGSRSLLREIPAKRVLTSVPDKMAWVANEACRQGQAWNWDGVQFDILHPSSPAGLKGNDASCVLRIRSASGQTLLLTGDIEAPAEARLLGQYGEGLRAEVLVVAHHGSKTSSSQAFVAQVAPEWVLFPLGYRNRYRFPHPMVYRRFDRRGSHLFDSAQHGALTVHLHESGIEVEAHRQSQGRYWHHGRGSTE